MPDVKVTLINSNPQEIDEDGWANICQTLYEMIIDNSPVDTGNFKSNWQLNQLASDIFEIYNPTEYSSFLEDGWSSQAPNGVIDPVIEKLPSIIRKYIGRKPKGSVYVSLEIPDYEPAR